MSKMTKEEREAESAYAAKAYKNRARAGKRLKEVLAERSAQKAAGLPVTAGTRSPELQAKIDAALGSRQVTIRMRVSAIEEAKRQAAAAGLRYQTYIKMLLHQALGV